MFRLSRYFSITSLIGIGIAVVGLSLYYRHVAVADLIQNETRSNVALTQSFVNSIWPNYQDFFKNAVQLSDDQLRGHAVITRLRQDLQRQMRGLNVIKVKIYGQDGRTIFSSDPAQIGEDKSGNAGFQQARAGQPASELVFRNTFYSFEQVMVDHHVLSSYLPMRKDVQAPVEGVFELYRDMNEFVAHMERTQLQIVGMVLAAFALLYAFLFIIVRRADRILRSTDAQREADAARIRFQAYHDALTGLPNRTSFMERVDEAIKRSRRSGQPFCVMFLDLDRFKLVNDSLGHEAGDQLLRVASKRITASVRETDTVFRMGGDEFTVVLENLDRAESAVLIARRIIKAMAEPVKLGEHDVIVTTSIGIANYPKDDTTADALVKDADAAMYRAKESGANRVEFYTEDMNAAAMQRLELETALQKALHNEEFRLVYQPKVAAANGRIVGIEALLRWHRPDKGVVSPDKFIPFLEETGLIVSVGEWVLRTACTQNKAWQASGVPPVRVSVNISPRQFRTESFIQTVRDVLAETALDPEYLELELTENLLIDDAESAIAIMEDLKTIGVYLSIDDFGTGYSSLNYLKRFPVDFLKIDRSFIVDLNTNKKDAAITSAIAALARNLKLGVVAEGVEEAAQAEFLRAQGYHEMQGYLFSRPVPPEECRVLLEKGKTAHPG